MSFTCILHVLRSVWLGTVLPDEAVYPPLPKMHERELPNLCSIARPVARRRPRGRVIQRASGGVQGIHFINVARQTYTHMYTASQYNKKSTKYARDVSRKSINGLGFANRPEFSASRR